MTRTNLLIASVFITCAVGCSSERTATPRHESQQAQSPSHGQIEHEAVNETANGSPHERNSARPPEIDLHDTLAGYVAEHVIPAIDRIPTARRRQLSQLSTYVQERATDNADANLTFICTHNSRRSHMAQLWAATAAAYYGLEHVHTYSGGTEATAFNPRAVAALERAGFQLENPGGDNPHYQVTFGPNTEAMACFSKVYSDPPNPQENFAAVLTCSQADRSCPVVFGASERVAVPYVDPKEADDTPAESSRYDERCLQIASEMFYLMSQVQS